MSTNLLAAAEPEVFEPTLGVSGDFPLDPAVVAGKFSLGLNQVNPD